MIVKLVGHAHKEGTSKTSGKPYAMILLYVAYADRYVVGQKTAELVVSPDMVADLTLSPGKEYNIDVNLQGRVCGLSQFVPPTQSSLFSGKGGK